MENGFGNPLELRTFIQMVLILEEMWCLESTQGIQKSTSKTEGRHHVRKVSLGFFSTKWNLKQSKTPISTLNSDLEKKTNDKRKDRIHLFLPVDGLIIRKMAIPYRNTIMKNLWLPPLGGSPRVAVRLFESWNLKPNRWGRLEIQQKPCEKKHISKPLFLGSRGPKKNEFFGDFPSTTGLQEYPNSMQNVTTWKQWIRTDATRNLPFDCLDLGFFLFKGT